MKAKIIELITTAIKALQAQDKLPQEVVLPINLGRTKSPEHGDFSSNIAMLLAKPCQKSPRELAELIVNALPADPDIKQVEIAGPGFINFFVNKEATVSVVADIIAAKEKYGFDPERQSYKINIEFVSTNPTGPLHVGHGRNAAEGASIANLLAAIGFNVHREYYVNDAGRQMDILMVSVWLRYLALYGETHTFPANAYKGDYVTDIAKDLKTKVQDKYVRPIAEVFANTPDDFNEKSKTGDQEAHIDALIINTKKLLAEQDYQFIFELTLAAMLADIREDLTEFGVEFDEWFSERELFQSGTQQRVIKKMCEMGHCYEKDGALWFKATDFGDTKDRVVQRNNGQYTYFANDVAYHVFKYERGIDKMIDVFGSDHHGYVPRMQAALKALGYSSKLGDILDVVLVQFAILYRGDEKVSMSTRSGDFVTLRELRQEVGNDAARFFLCDA